MDTAGIRETSDKVEENLGIERSREAFTEADLIIIILDGSMLYPRRQRDNCIYRRKEFP